VRDAHAGNRVYWKEIRSDAWARTKLKMFSRERRLFSLRVPLISAGIAVVILSILHQPIPLSIGITLISAFGGLAIAAMWEWLHEVLAIPVEKHDAQERIIREKDEKFAELTNPTDRLYSELQLTKLSRLKQDGRSLLEHHIAPNQNQSVARQELETWIKDYRDWRKEILEILNEKDATVFEAPVSFNNTNFQIPGLSGPYNLDHARLRNQLLAEISRLEGVLT